MDETRREPWLPPYFPRYCRWCGAPLAFTHWSEEARLQGAQRQGTVSWRCTGCGDESGAGWGWGSAAASGNEGRTVTARSPALAAGARAGETSAVPAPTPLQCLAAPAVVPPEALEHERRYAAVMRDVDARGFAAALDHAPYPIFALDPTSAAGGRLLPRSPSYASYGWSQGQPVRAGISKVSVAYVAPGYEEPEESVLVESADAARHEGPAAPERYVAHGQSLFLQYFVQFTPRPLRDLREDAAYLRFVNVAALSAAPISRVVVTLASGEKATWEVRHLPAPVPLVHAGARVAGTALSVALAGTAVGAVEEVLGSLTRLAVGSAELTALGEGLQTAAEHFRQKHRETRHEGTW